LQVSSRKQWRQPVSLVLNVPALFASQLSVLSIIQAALLSGFYRLLLQGSQESSLFPGQDTPNPEFGRNPHSHRRSLRGRNIAHALFYHCFVRIVGIQRFVQRFIGHAQPLIYRDALCLVGLPNRTYLFALLWCQIELANWVAAAGALLRLCRGDWLLTCLTRNRGNSTQNGK
jgi:hypothetical protein